MHLFLLGLSHKTAPVEVRERLSVSPTQLPRALRALRESGGAHEVAILSTCNRTEIYAIGTSDVAKKLERFIRKFHLTSPQASQSMRNLSSCLYRSKDAATARHLFQVASGIDSLILGESEILGQVKTAFEISQEQGALSGTLGELFRRALTCGKRARTETEIGHGAQSVGTAAVALSRQIFGELRGHTVLILGAGKISSLTARALVASGAREVIVANRTYQRARELAHGLCADGAEAKAMLWEELPQQLAEADIVIASTHAPHTVLHAEQIEAAMRMRRHRPIFLIDLAVPRDIDPLAHQLDDVFVYDVDDLKNVVDSGRSQRESEIIAVQRIIDDEVSSWQKWQRGLDARPVQAALAQYGRQVQESELEAAFARLPDLSETEKQAVRRFAQSLTGKLLHPPLRYLREAGESGSGDVETIQRAFALELSQRETQKKNSKRNPR